MRPTPKEMIEMMGADKVNFRTASVADGMRRHLDIPSADAGRIEWDDPESPACLRTWAVLEDCLDIDRDLQRRWEQWDVDSGEELDWFESAREFVLSSKEYDVPHRFRDNTYNYDCDLDQDFVFEAYDGKDVEHDDDLHEPDLTVVFLHLGLDARQGYGRPLFCRPRTNSLGEPCRSLFNFFNVEYTITEARRGKKSLDWEEMQSLDEYWSAAYAQCPWSELEKDVARWFNYGGGGDADNPRWPCLLKSGELCMVRARDPYDD